MTDLSQTIAPKSDQLNADDLIGGPKTIRVTKVARASEPDQPIAISFEGDGGKPYKPCKSMRRVLVTVWGVDGNSYAGKCMTLFRDDKVQFGGMAVGGIRISHMSGIERDATMALTVTKARRAPYTVKPLREQPAQSTAQAPKRTKADLFRDARAEAAKGSFALEEWRAGLPERARAVLGEIDAELASAADAADAEADGTGGNSEQAQEEEVV